MIRILNFRELDVKRYEICIRNSVQYNFQAEPDFLKGINSSNWDFLVYGDYEAVMPVYFKKKFGLKFVIPPPYINQLGIFSVIDDEKINEEFLNLLTSKFNIVYYPFNSKNTISGLEKRINFRLESQAYADAKKNYSIHRRRNVRLRDPDLEFSEIESISKVKDFFLAHVLGMKNDKMKANYFRTLERLSEEKLLKIYALSRNGKLVSAAFMSDFPDEMALLALINSKTEITANDPSILMDQIIQKHISTESINFFGSNIAAVAEFYRRFGAQEERYPYIFNTKKDVLKKLLKLIN